jgi:hypothetical protein
MSFIDENNVRTGAIGGGAVAGSSPTFTMRLLVQLLYPPSDGEARLYFTFAGLPVVVSPLFQKTISETGPLVFSAEGFSSADEALNYGISLQASLAIAACLEGAMVDVGFDNAAARVLRGRENGIQGSLVPGVNVVSGTAKVLFQIGELSLVEAKSAKPLLRSIERLGSQWAKLDDKARSAALMLSSASVAQHPAAAMVICVSAVELLASGGKWNAAQSAWIDRAKQQVGDCLDLSDDDKEELLPAVNNLHTYGANAKIRSLISSLGLEDIRPQWVKLYSERSKFLHGDRVYSYHELVGLEAEARALATKIVEAYILKNRSVER